MTSLKKTLNKKIETLKTHIGVMSISGYWHKAEKEQANKQQEINNIRSLINKTIFSSNGFFLLEDNEFSLYSTQFIYFNTPTSKFFEPFYILESDKCFFIYMCGIYKHSMEKEFNYNCYKTYQILHTENHLILKKLEKFKKIKKENVYESSDTYYSNKLIILNKRKYLTVDCLLYKLYQKYHICYYSLYDLQNNEMKNICLPYNLYDILYYYKIGDEVYDLDKPLIW